MRLAIAGQTYLPSTNGQGVFTVHLAQGLVRAGHDVLIMAPSNRVLPCRTDHKGVRVAGITALPLVPFAPRVRVTPYPNLEVGGLLDRFRPDVVHVQDHYPLCRAVARASCRRGIPLVVTNHFLPQNITAQLPAACRRRETWLEALLWSLVLQVFEHADIATAPTETAAQILRRQRIPVPVLPISCGVELARFRLDGRVNQAAIRLRYGLDSSGILFLYLGRVDQDKGVDVLIRALAHVRRDDVHLAIAGRGRHEDALRGLVHRLGLDGRVAFTGYVPGDDLPMLLNSVEYFAMPSEAELQSIATLEAMAAGRPVLAAQARALPELVKPGVNGRLFRAGDPADAARCMRELAAASPGERQRMSAASLVIAQSHDLQHTVRSYERLYRVVRTSGR
jgi:glycosyltransferase involved in cell wall biosynthesis